MSEVLLARELLLEVRAERCREARQRWVETGASLDLRSLQETVEADHSGETTFIFSGKLYAKQKKGLDRL